MNIDGLAYQKAIRDEWSHTKNWVNYRIFIKDLGFRSATVDLIVQNDFFLILNPKS